MSRPLRSRFHVQRKRRLPVEENKALKPPVEVVHIGGPWYWVGDEKVMGRANAEARAKELNES